MSLSYFKFLLFFLQPTLNKLDLSSLSANATSDQIKVLETLSKENVGLRAELEDLSKKVSKVSVLEQEMSKIHTAYQSLLKHSEKRETLEKAARQKLQNVIINLTEVNKVSYYGPPTTSRSHIIVT